MKHKKKIKKKKLLKALEVLNDKNNVLIKDITTLVNHPNSFAACTVKLKWQILTDMEKAVWSGSVDHK